MPLKAGVVQFSPLYGQVEQNLQRLETLVHAGVEQGAEILVLPEMAWTGYLWPSQHHVDHVAEVAGLGPGQDRLRAWARLYQVALVAGYPEREGELYFNSQTLVAPSGEIAVPYRKRHLFQADTWWASEGGASFRQWCWNSVSVGSGICMDLNYPDLVGFHAQNGTAILAFSTNWIDEGFDVIPYWEDRLSGAGETPPFRGLALFADRGGEASRRESAFRPPSVNRRAARTAPRPQGSAR